jgi:hypothetical protein
MNLTWDGIEKYPRNTFQIPVTRMEYEYGLRGIHCIYSRQPPD